MTLIRYSGGHPSIPIRQVSQWAEELADPGLLFYWGSAENVVGVSVDLAENTYVEFPCSATRVLSAKQEELIVSTRKTLKERNIKFALIDLEALKEIIPTNFHTAMLSITDFPLMLTSKGELITLYNRSTDSMLSLSCIRALCNRLLGTYISPGGKTVHLRSDIGIATVYYLLADDIGMAGRIDTSKDFGNWSGIDRISKSILSTRVFPSTLNVERALELASTIVTGMSNQERDVILDIPFTEAVSIGIPELVLQCRGGKTLDLFIDACPEKYSRIRITEAGAVVELKDTWKRGKTSMQLSEDTSEDLMTDKFIMLDKIADKDGD